MTHKTHPENVETNPSRLGLPAPKNTAATDRTRELIENTHPAHLGEPKRRYNLRVISKLSDAEITSGLAALPGWTVQHEKLHRSYKFPDFAHAMGFMATCAPSIEKKNHHPEWANVYSTVTVHLATHDSGGITQKDMDLAVLMEKIAQKLL